jgi:hypothetical protein
MSGLLELPGSNRYDALAQLLKEGPARSCVCMRCICSLQLLQMLAVARKSPFVRAHSCAVWRSCLPDCQLRRHDTRLGFQNSWCAAGCTEETLKQVLYPLQLACASNMQVRIGGAHTCTSSSRCWLMRAQLTAH